MQISSVALSFKLETRNHLVQTKNFKMSNNYSNSQPIHTNGFGGQNHADSKSSSAAQMLRQQAQSFKIGIDNLEKQFYRHKTFYVISADWIKKWKSFVKYSEAVGEGGSAEESSTEAENLTKLPPINNDIIDQNNPIDIEFEEPYDILNIALKPGLKEGVDYLLLDKDTWDIFKDYQRLEVKRLLEQTSDGKKVEVYFRRIGAICLYNELLQAVETERVTKFSRLRIQLPQYKPLGEELMRVLSEKVKTIVKFTSSSYAIRNCQATFGPEKIKFWKIEDDMSQTKFVEHLAQGCKSCRRLSYRMSFPGSYVNLETQAIVDSLITPESTVVLEIKEKKQDWIFFTKDHIISGRCQSCNTIEKLTVFCSCKDAAYCSKECKKKDKDTHRIRCQRKAQSSQEEAERQFTQYSKRGRMGLKNLGNTCFMNSGIQCLTSIEEFTEYFLRGQYLKEINMFNPLGTKGELSHAYGKLIAKMWFDCENSTAPSALKRAIGRFQPMFSGYDQHDSGELISYLLDGLHEDLNRIIKKPYIETKDYDGREDDVIAQQSWENFLKRNQSEVVDLMYGQYRSKLDCPKCSKVSVIFDPFMMIPLPIPQQTRESISVHYQNTPTQAVTFPFFYQNDTESVQALLNSIGSKLAPPVPGLSLMAYSIGYDCKFIPYKTFPSLEFRYTKQIIVRKIYPFQDLANGVSVVLFFTDALLYRKQCGKKRLLFLPKTMTAKQLHQLLFEMFGQKLNVQNYEEEIINEKEKEFIKWKVKYSTPSSYLTDCPFCKTKNCHNCAIPYSDEVTVEAMEDMLHRSRPSDTLQIQITLHKQSDKVLKSIEHTVKMASSLTGGGITIEDCFRLFEQPETLQEDNQWYCPTCKQLVKAKKQLGIYKAPKILILNLKRFKSRGYKGLYKSKLETLVKFPIKNLDVGNFVINHNLPKEKGGSMKAEQPLLYDLFAISNHYGSLGGGHYTAYCKKNGTWNEYDDSSVSAAQENNLCSSSSYVLFYKRKEQQK